MGGNVYFGAGAGVLVLDATTGTLVREYIPAPSGSPTATTDDAPSIWTRPALSGGAIVVAGAVASVGFDTLPSWMLYAFDQASGRVLWQRPSESETSFSAPVAMDLPMGG